MRTPLQMSRPNGPTASIASRAFSAPQAAREVERHRDALAYRARERPVVTPAGAAELLHRQRGVARVEQQRVDVRRDADGLVDGGRPVTWITCTIFTPGSASRSSS